MEYRGKPTQSNLSADRLAQIFAHVQDAKAAAAQAKAAGAEAAASSTATAEQEQPPQGLRGAVKGAKTWKPRRAYIDLGGPKPEAAAAKTHRGTPCDNLPAGPAPAAGGGAGDGEDGDGGDKEERNYLDAPRDALPQDPSLRSSRWFLADELNTMRHVSRTKQMGYDDKDFQGKPIIGIINTWSDLLPCHSHFKERVEEVKRGVWQAGGFPAELPAMAVSETFMKPSSMLYRNFLAMQVEELLRSHPCDGAVLMGGCDKTTPGVLMGALSMDIPIIFVPAGPMLRGNSRGKILGSGADQWAAIDEYRAGTIDECGLRDVEEGIARSAGHCMTAGTASTMTACAETMGLSLPGASSIPAVDANHQRMATHSGRRIVEMVGEKLIPSKIVTAKSMENAITCYNLLGGSTNAVIHLIAIAGRLGITLPLEKFDEIGKVTPLIANLRPTGNEYLMEDFFYAGGLPALLSRVPDLLHGDQLTITGRTLAEDLSTAEVYNDDVIRTKETALFPDGGMAVLKGNLCPGGAVIKANAGSPEMLSHTGPACVFKNYDDLSARIDDPDLPVTKDSVLILQNGGPVGGPGMPEWGMMAIPKKLLQAGVRDMVRISDSRMSGTSYGTCVLHVTPEAAIGGPLGLVQDGDMVKLDVPNRTLDMLVSEEELAQRRAQWTPALPMGDTHYGRGYGLMYSQHVTQADQGCDLDFLHHGPAIPEPSIHH